MGSGFQLFLEMTGLGVIYHKQKDSCNLYAKTPPIFFTFENLRWSERVSPYEIAISDELYFWGTMRYRYSVKRVLPFSTFVT